MIHPTHCIDPMYISNGKAYFICIIDCSKFSFTIESGYVIVYGTINIFSRQKHHFDFKHNVKIYVMVVTMVSVHLNTFWRY